MVDSPVERIRRAAGTPQADDETIKQYVTRVGEEFDIAQERVDAALAYVTGYYYSDGDPDDSEGLTAFLEAVESARMSREQSETDGSDGREGSTRRTPVVAPPAGESRGGPAGFKSGIRGKEPRKLVLRFFVIVATAPVVGWMVARAWVPGNAIYDQGRAALAQGIGLPETDAAKLFVVFLFGAYLGLLTLFTIDVKKRVQAMLLWLGTLLALVAVAALGWVIPRLALTELNVLGFLLGLVSGLIIEFDQLRAIDIGASTFRRPTLSNGAVPEFRYAAALLFGVVSIVVVATLAQVILAGTVAVADPVAAVVLLGVAFQFVSYESETNYVTLGPERSGKSMLVLGLCLTLLRSDTMHPSPNDYLQESLERASNLKPGQSTWPIPSTSHDELQTASFEVIAGSYFPRRLELRALDYAGQHLARIAAILEDGDSTTPDGGSMAAERRDESSVPQQVVEWVRGSDTLLVLLDVERLVYPAVFQDAESDAGTVSWGLDQYTTIIEGTTPDDVLVIATKCDILVDQGVVDAPQAYESYDEYRGAVTEHLRARPDVQELLATTDEATIHPVFFVTERQDGTYVPYLDADGNLVPVGYDHLIDELRARQ